MCRSGCARFGASAVRLSGGVGWRRSAPQGDGGVELEAGAEAKRHCAEDVWVRTEGSKKSQRPEEGPGSEAEEAVSHGRPRQEQRQDRDLERREEDEWEQERRGLRCVPEQRSVGIGGAAPPRQPAVEAAPDAGLVTGGELERRVGRVRRG